MYLSASINRLMFVETLLYSAFFPEESIRFTKAAVCQSSHNIIDIFYMNTTATTEHFLKLLYSECPVPVLLNQLGKYIENAEKDTRPSTKVLLINTVEQLDAFMEYIYEFRIGKDKRKYFVIIERNNEPNPDQWLYYLFAKFWRKQILNVVVVFYKESVQIYTYHLLEDGRNSNANNTSESSVASSNSEQIYQEQEFYLNVMNITSYPTSKWFFNKLTNLQKRKLVVTMIGVPSRAYLRKDKTSYTGIDGNVADLIRSRMNATFTYISPKFSFNGSNNTGPFGDVVHKRAHFSFNVHAYAPYNFNNTVEQTNSFDHVRYCVIVPKNGLKPIAFNIFHSMTLTIWILVIASIITVTVALAAVQHFHKKIRKRNKNVSAKYKNYTAIELASIVLQSFFGDTIEQVAFHHSLRYILLGWLIYSFLITSAFTAKIISSLIKPNHRENINTIAELGASNLTILYPKPLAKNIEKGFDNDTFRLFEDNFKEINSWEQHLNILDQNKTQYAYVLADYFCLYIVRTNINNKTGESMFHMVPECLASHPKVYLAQRGSMYLGYVNELLGRFHEFGMFRRWVAEASFFSLMKGRRIGYQAADEEIDYATAKVVMNMEYLQTPFYMLALGLFLSIIIFCVEKGWYTSVNRKRRAHNNEGTGIEEEIEVEIE